MAFVCNFPAFSIVLSMMAAIVSSALKGKWAKRLNMIVLFIVMGMSVCVLGYTIGQGDFFVYTMGKFPAPWGNEIRAGVLEGIMATFFCVIMIFAGFFAEKNGMTKKKFSCILLLVKNESTRRRT